jgi:hypothetical protein
MVGQNDRLCHVPPSCTVLHRRVGVLDREDRGGEVCVHGPVLRLGWLGVHLSHTFCVSETSDCAIQVRARPLLRLIPAY